MGQGHGERFTERITLEQPHRVTFTRIAGPVLGTIANEIEGPEDDLRLRFSFALVVAGVEGGSAAEQEYAGSMTADYLKAVAATLSTSARCCAATACPSAPNPSCAAPPRSAAAQPSHKEPRAASTVTVRGPTVGSTGASGAAMTLSQAARALASRKRVSWLNPCRSSRPRRW